MRSFVLVAAVTAVAPAIVYADPTPAPAPSAPDDGMYLAPHPDAPWWLSAQDNVIVQAQPGFHSPYAGSNSFLPSDHVAVSNVGTVYAGYELAPNTAIVIAGETADGAGLSSTLGIAGYPNLDAVRNPTLGPTPYIGRAYLTQVIPLSDDRVHADRNPLHVRRTAPSKRIEIHAGKMSAPDFFDPNTEGTDSHLQFMNWAVDNNGAWDYAADTRGYTLGFIIELIEPKWAVRLGELLMPTVANGVHYDYDIAHARGENLEGEWHACVLGRPGVVRVLAYLNHAKMGSYADAIAESVAAANIGEQLTPDITQSRAAGRLKYGFGVNAEQEVSADLHVFARVGWSDGNNESFAYTEVDNTLLVGADLRGRAWGRPTDKIGVALVSNGLSSLHSEYLALGGLGFLLGDGQLNYGREDIAEAYYTMHAYRGVFPAVDVQAIDNPGYNKDRGPVVVGSLRLHVEL